MPADDLVLNVRQIAGYPSIATAPSIATLLMQLGIGGPYQSISPADLVGTALAQGGDMAIGGSLSAQAFSGGSAQFSNAAVGMFTAQKACLVNLAALTGTIGGVPIASTLDVAASVTSFNMRGGAVILMLEDILCAGGAPIYSPRFSGNPRAATPCPESNSTRLATTAYVTAAIATLVAGEGLVSSFNTRVGAIVLTAADVLAADPPYAPIDSPAFTGYATSLTPPPGASDGQIATTAFVMNAVQASTTGVASFNTRTGAVVLTAADVIAAGGAPIAAPAFTGIPTAPTATVGTNTTQLATCAFVNASTSGGFAPINSPAFTGTPTGPTPAVGNNSTQLATTAYVLAAITAVDAGVLMFNGRTGNVTLIANDISAAGGATLLSPAFTGTPTGPTAAAGTNTTQLATTAFVLAQIGAAGGVTTFNGRAGAVTMTVADVNAAGGPYLALAGGTMTGQLQIPGVNGVGAITLAASASGVSRNIFGTTGGNARWAISLGNATTEGGTSAGSDFSVSRYLNTGAFIDAPLLIARSTGLASFSAGIAVPATSSSIVAMSAGGWTTLNGSNVGVGGAGNSAIIVNGGGRTTFMQEFYNAASQLIMFGGDGSAFKPGGGTWTSPSDARIKTVQGDYALGLDEVLQLRPVNFTYKGNDTGEPLSEGAARAVRTGAAPYPASMHYALAVEQRPFVGLIAQEVEAIFPAMVKRAAGFIDGVAVADVRNLDPSELIFALVNAVKTLAARVATLEAAT
jgi:hypothetical protein